MARGNNKISSSTLATTLKISKRYWFEVQEFSSLRFGELLSWFIEFVERNLKFVFSTIFYIVVRVVHFYSSNLYEGIPQRFFYVSNKVLSGLTTICAKKTIFYLHKLMLLVRRECFLE